MVTTKDEYVQDIKAQLQRCHGYEGDEVSKARESALNRYFRRADGNEVAGRSHYVSGDVSAMVEANLASTMEAFSSDRIAEFDALSPEDEDQAQLESDVVQYFVMQKANGKLQFRQGFKDALLLRNGIIKTYVSEKTTTRSNVLRDVDPIARAALSDITSYDANTKEATQRTTKTVREFKCEAVPLENFLYYADWHKHDLQDIPFCAERHISSRSELVELFPKKKKVIENLNVKVADDKPDANARNPKKAAAYRPGLDESQEPIEWFECYLLADRDGDGISERRKVCLAYDELLDDYPVNIVPYAAGTAIINSHRFLGISLDDKLHQEQSLNTGLNRALMDNANAVNKNRVAAINGVANFDDLTDGRPNGVIRVDKSALHAGGVQAAIMPFAVVDNTANLLANIQHVEHKRSEMGGAALDMSTANMQSMGDGVGSQGVERAYSASESRAADMTDTLASTLVRNVFLIAHATMREWFNEPTTIKANGRWLEAVPSKWPVRESVTIKPGMSAGERSRRANVLRQIITDQLALDDRGYDGIMVSGDKFYNAYIDWMRVQDVPHGEQYFVDPTTPEAQQAIEQKQQAAQLQQKLKIKLMQDSLQTKKLELAVDKHGKDADRVVKVWEKTQDMEGVEATLAADAVTKMLMAQKGKTNGQDNSGESAGAADADSEAA